LAIIARGWRPIWALGNAGMIGKFEVLAGIEALTVFADRDPNGAVQRAAEQCAQRWQAAGREATIRLPTVDDADWNNVG
jgi:putative DNA primase/helicase